MKIWGMPVFWADGRAFPAAAEGQIQDFINQ